MIWIMIIMIVALALIGVPMSFSMLTGSVWFMLTSGMPQTLMTQRLIMAVGDSFSMLAIPFFMLAGTIMNAGGVATRIFDFCNTLVGHIPGGLGHVNVFCSVIFAGMSGSAVADAGGLGAIEMEAMKKNGYDEDFAGAVTAASSVIGPIFPPSIPLIIYGSVASVSVDQLFMGGVVPGLLMGVLLMVMVLYFAIVRRYERHPFRLRALIRQFLGSIPALITPVIILCGFVVGWFTPTEASSIAVIYSLLIALFLYRTLDWKSFKKCLKDSAISSANTLFIIGTSTLFTYVMAMEGISRQFADVILGISSNPNVVLLVINVLLLVLGMVMEPGAILTLMLPVLLPIANGLGLDLVHFGVMVVLNLMIGQVTPPFGVCLFVISDVNKLKLERLYRSILPFLVPLILTLILVTYIPGIVTALPNALLS